jgi:hypothetical protein
MENDSKSLRPAVVDVSKVKFSKSPDLGIDFANEIDAWARMEFKYRQQIKLLKTGTLDRHETLRDSNSLVYALREKID